jgi:hypothetical protein
MEKSGGKSDAQSPKVTSGALLPTTLAEGWIERLTKFYLIPEGPFLSNWDRFIVLLTVINCVLLSFMVAFSFQDTAAWCVCYFIDLMFILDVYLKFHVAYLQNGFWVVFPREMAIHYFRSKEFIYDVFCSLPYDIIAFGWVGKPDVMYILTLVRLPKFIRVAKMLVFFRGQEKKLHASFLVQILKFTCYLLTLTHSIACVWFAIACPKGTSDSCSSPAWTYKFGLHNAVDKTFKSNLGSIYITTLYWTSKLRLHISFSLDDCDVCVTGSYVILTSLQKVTTMTTCGYGDITPQNDDERVFAIVAMMSGTFFYGYVSGRNK